MDRRSIRRDAKQFVESALQSGGWEKFEIFDPTAEGEYESIYMGSSLNCPSGKYYTPFANSNVDACPRCKGKGCDFCGWLGSREAYEDQVWFEDLDYYAEREGCFIDTGEGCATDLFITREVVHPSKTA